jgi:uncharacterized membrane protein (DUF106 family)
MVDFLAFIQQNPRISIIFIALAISFLITLVNYFLLDKERLRDIKEKQKTIQKQIKEHQKAGNHEKVLELNKELMGHAGEMMRHSLKPMLITLIPILLLFSFIRGIFVETVISKTWFWYYLVSAMVGSIIFKKLFNLP